MYPNLPHEADVPKTHPGVSEPPERNLITILYRKPITKAKDPSDTQIEDTQLRVSAQVADSTELAMFLFSNGHPYYGIVGATEHGPVDSLDWDTVVEAERSKYDIVPPVARK